MSLLEVCNRALGSLLVEVHTGGVSRKPSRDRKRIRKFEHLEDRLLMSVTQDASGWTVVGASADTRTIYVSSSSGNDANNGLTPETAKSTIAAGVALMRSGMPDHLLLKRGDTWTITDSINPTSGRSADEPTLFGTYGSGNRPKIETADEHGVRISRKQFVYVIGWQLEAVNRATDSIPNGISISFDAWDNGIALNGNVLIEDCYVDGYGSALISSGDGSLIAPNLTIRRNVFVNSWNVGNHSQGMYVEYVNGLLIEDNFFDHNGWNESVVGAEATIFNHSMYLTHANLNVTVRNNIVSRSSSMGLKFQPVEGTHYITNNLFIGNGYAAQIGGGKAADQVGKTGATIYANDNVFLEGAYHIPDSSGNGVTISNVKAGTFSNNIVANRTSTGNKFALSLQDGIAGWETIGVGVRDFTIDNNVFYNWRGAVQVRQPTESYQGGPLPVMENIDFIDNKLQEPSAGYTGKLIDTYTASSSVNGFTGGAYYSAGAASQPFRVGSTSMNLSSWKSATGETNATQQKLAFFDSTRTSVTYAASLGLTSYDELMVEMRAQSRDNWRTEFTADAVNDYIRAGFELDPVGITPLPAPSLGAPTGQSIQQQPAPGSAMPALQDSSHSVNRYLPAQWTNQMFQSQSAALDQLLISSVNRLGFHANDDVDSLGFSPESSMFNAADWNSATDQVFGEFESPLKSGLRRGVFKARMG